jgi:hypothetical protein
VRLAWSLISWVTLIVIKLVSVNMRHLVHEYFTSKILEIGWDLIYDALYFCNQLFWRHIQYNIASIMFTYCIMNIICSPIMSSIPFFSRTTFRVLCLRWYKTCRESQGFLLTTSTLEHFVVVLYCLIVLLQCFFYCLVVLLFNVLHPYHCLVSQSFLLLLIVFHRLSTT